MEIRSKEIRLVPIGEIKPSPRNNNKHTDEQATRLEKIMRHQGFRSPLVVSNQSGNLVAGHLRLDVARRLGYKEVPVSFQDFDTDADEYAHMTADNAIASWSELDLSGINMAIPDFGPEMDLEMLGIKNFILEPMEFEEPPGKEDPTLKDPLLKQCPNCGVTFG